VPPVIYKHVINLLHVAAFISDTFCISLHLIMV